MVNQKVEPLPHSEVTPTSPFIIRHNSLEIAKPKPVPPKDFFVELSTCWKALKRILRFSSVIPIPESIISTLIRLNFPLFSIKLTLILTVPFSVNFKAFEVKLERIWSNRVSSAITNSGKLSSKSVIILLFLAVATWLKSDCNLSKTSLKTNGASLRDILPASIFAKSRISFKIWSNVSEDFLMVWT